MPAAASLNGSNHTPAWKRLGLKLKSVQAPQDPAIESPKEIDTSKRKRTVVAEDHTPSKKSKKIPTVSEPSTQEPITPKLVRKKSVTFTPETKAEDGDSIKQLFNSWVAEQKLQDPSFQLNSSQPAFEVPEPAQVEEQVDPKLDEKERRVKRIKKPKEEKSKNAAKSKKPSQTAKLTAPPRPFLQYLRQYHESRDTWKFNKNHQNHLLKHIFDLDVVPSDHAHLIYIYIRGLQGGVRTRLRDAALAIKVKDQEDGAAGFSDNMAESDKRQREYNAALTEYVATMTAVNASSKMGYEEGKLLGLSDRAMAKRVAKRARAEEILNELASSPGEGSGTSDKEVANGDDESQKRVRMNDGSTQKVARKRKQRTITADDESISSDDSNDSDDSSSDSSTAQNEGADDTSSSSSSSSSDSESEEEDSDEESEEESDESDDSE